MVYPINKEDFMLLWRNECDNPDAGDMEIGEAIVDVVNLAYQRGLEDGKEAAGCKK